MDYAMQHNMAIRLTRNPRARRVVDDKEIGKFLRKKYQYLLEHNYGTGLREAKRGQGWELIRK